MIVIYIVQPLYDTKRLNIFKIYLYDRFEGIFKIVIRRISVHDKEPVGKSDDQHEKVDETFSKMSGDVVKHDTYPSS